MTKTVYMKVVAFSTGEVMSYTKEQAAAYYQANRQKYLDSQNKRRQECRLRLEVYKRQQKCDRCGFDEHPVALDFHHLDPATKDRTIAQMVIDRVPWDKVLLEIAKCRVLCSNCHRIVEHVEQGNYEKCPRRGENPERDVATRSSGH